jgi:hypothetical protein
MTAVIAGTRLADDLGVRGPSPAQTAGPAVADRAQATARRARAVRSWPLLVLAAPAAAEVWSGWVGIAQKTGFGLVSPLPGIWPALHLDTAITLPVGVEAYAAYALRAWLSGGHEVSAQTRRFAKWSAIFSFALGMAGQVAYHLLAQAGVTRAPWAITTIVSCLPVLVLAMGTALAHMLRADAVVTAAPESTASRSATVQSPDWSRGDQPAKGQEETSRRRTSTHSGPPAGTRLDPCRDKSGEARTVAPASWISQQKMDQARLITRRLAAAGKPVSRRALRGGGIKGSNEALNVLARELREHSVDSTSRHG